MSNESIIGACSYTLSQMANKQLWQWYTTEGFTEKYAKKIIIIII